MGHRILMIDDDKDLCYLQKNNLEAEGYDVTVRNNGISGLDEALSGNYQLVVLDIMLPGKSGFDVLTELRRTSNVPVLMLTAKDSEADKVSGLRLGADDYLTKPFSNSEFIARVASLLRRYTIFDSVREESNPCLTIGGLSINNETREVKVDDHSIELTAKEFDLLYFLANNKGRVFTKKQIYRAVWEDEYAFDDNNIMVHIRRLRKKIEPDPDNPVYVLTVWGVGYRFGGDTI